MKKITILLFSILISFNSYSSAQLYYSKYKENPSKYDEYLQGVEAGFAVYGVFLESDPLYCPPKKMTFNIDNIKDFIDRFAKNKEKDNKPIPSNYPVSFLLIKSLQSIFPCADT